MGGVFGCYSDVDRQGLLRQILETEEEIRMAETMLTRITPAEAKALRQMSEDKYQMDMAASRYEYRMAKRRYKRMKAKIMEEGREWGLEQGLDEGRAQGLEQGLEQGLQQGIKQTKQEIARRMKEQGLSEEQIRALIDTDGLSSCKNATN
ncbi:MAG: hypothetical protein LBD20_00560 [Spirochaetaceae bacterium]|jgi:flagellar biosynthesis/type III secretory pathway protein FliH|nr:hypothetical protein [Spirochaetaceae bacterium]